MYTYLNLLVRRSKWRNFGTVSHAVSSVHLLVGRGRGGGQEGGFRGSGSILEMALLLDGFFILVLTIDSNFSVIRSPVMVIYIPALTAQTGYNAS